MFNSCYINITFWSFFFKFYLAFAKDVLVTNMHRNIKFCKSRDAGECEIIDEYQPHVNQADNAPNE